ncbi:MAG: carbohydrate binding domain-containing protein [Spirochaetes bacterium]|nr:carbohydrate binding domain-containing protein [Spirochaetota bacterium]
MTRRFILIITGAILMSMAANGAHPREGTEWDTAYWYNANDNKLPRVLLLGDSICNGYQTAARDALAGTAYVSFYATSKCVTDRSYLKALTYILDEYDYTVIHFNNGLHSLGTDRAEWEAGLRAAIKLIREKKPSAKLIWCSSTPLKDSALTEKAKALNAIGAKVAAELGLPVNDLFSLMDPLERAKYWTDTYHYNNDAKKMQAAQVAETIRAVMGGKTATADEAKKALASAASDTGPDGKITTVADAGPVLKNGNFEETGGWNVYPFKEENVTLAITDEGAYAGKSAKITVLKAGAQFYQHKPMLTPGATYRISYRVRAEQAATIQVHVRTQKPPYELYGDHKSGVGTEWKEFSATLTVPAGFKPEAHVFFFNFATPGVYWIDDVKVEKQ